MRRTALFADRLSQWSAGGHARRLEEAELPLEKVFADWPIATDPQVHVTALRKLFDSGVTIVNVHSGQPDQQKIIDFYGRSVIPQFAA